MNVKPRRGCYEDNPREQYGQRGLDGMEEIKHHSIVDQIPQYLYCDGIVGLTGGAFATYFENSIFVGNYQ